MNTPTTPTDPRAGHPITRPTSDPTEHDGCPADIYRQAGEVEDIAWAEIDALATAGLPVCDIVWAFLPDDAAWLGRADTLPDGRARINLDDRPAEYLQYGTDLDATVRSAVRHEYAHHIVWASHPDSDAALRATFTVPLLWDAPAPGNEAAAEVVAAVLAGDQEQVRFYAAQAPSEAELIAASALVERAITE